MTQPAAAPVIRGRAPPRSRPRTAPVPPMPSEVTSARAPRPAGSRWRRAMMPLGKMRAEPPAARSPAGTRPSTRTAP